MSDIKVEGFKVCNAYVSRWEVDGSSHDVLARTQSSEILAQLAQVFDKFSDEEKKQQIKKVRCLFLPSRAPSLIHLAGWNS